MKMTLLITACMIAVTTNQLWTVGAGQPSEVAPPGSAVCVYPGDKSYRCNHNERVSEAQKTVLKAEIIAHKQRITDIVDAGDIDALLSFYTDDAVIFESEDVAYYGKDELRAFFERIIGGGKSSLVISNGNQWRVLSHRHVVLVYGEWQMDGNHGRYLYEDYYKQEDGTWRCHSKASAKLG